MIKIASPFDERYFRGHILHAATRETQLAIKDIAQGYHQSSMRLRISIHIARESV